jgi:O-antigen/teichoic acid export membrane protein
MQLTDKFFALFIRDAVLFFSTLLTGVVIARQLGPDMMGIWAILLLIPGYAEAFGRLKLDISIVYFIGKDSVSIGVATFILHAAALLATVIIFTLFLYNFDWFYDQIFKNVELDVKGLVYAILILIPLRFIYINYSYLLISQKDVYSYNILIIIQALTTSIFSIGMILILKMGIFGALLGSVIGLLSSIFYGAVKVHHIEKIDFDFDLKILFKLFKYSMNSYLGGLIGFSQNHVASLISTLYVAPAQIAFYVMSKTICEIATRMVPSAVNTILFPWISTSDNVQNSKQLVARSFRITLLILIFSTSMLILLIKPIVFVLYGVEYYPIIDLFLIMIIGVVLTQSSSVFNSYFSGCGRPDIPNKASIIPLLLQVFFSIIFIPKFGVTGAAISYVLSSVLLFIFQLYYFIKFSRSSLSVVFIRHQDFETIFKFVILKVINPIFFKNRRS